MPTREGGDTALQKPAGTDGSSDSINTINPVHIQSMPLVQDSILPTHCHKFLSLLVLRTQ